MRSFLFITVSLLLACLSTACSEDGRTRGPSTRVVAINAAPTHPELAFLREERVSATLPYRAVSSLDFEVGQYDFNIDTFQPGDLVPQRELSFSETLEPETDYCFVITGVSGSLQRIAVTKPFFAPTATNSEVTIVHAAPALPAVSLYLTAPGANLSAANPIGGVSFTQTFAPQTFSSGDYQLSLTESGSPLNVLYASPTVALVAGRAYLFVLTDGTAEMTAQVAVVIVSVSSGTLIDVNSTPQLRVLNAPNDLQPRDIVFDSNFAAPLFPSAPYGAPTGFQPISAGDRKINVTPPGNPGVIEGELQTAIAPARYYTAVVVGAAGDLDITAAIENQRSVVDEAHLRIYNGAAQFSSLDFFVLPPGTPISGFFPLRVVPGGWADTQTLRPGNFEITVRNPTTQAIAYGPAPITVASGRIYSVLALQGATPETVALTLFDDF